MINKENKVKSPVFHHVNFKTNQIEAMIDWYRTVLGCEVTFESPGIAFLTNDAANHRIAITNSPAFSKDHDRIRHVGVHHSAFEYETLDDLLSDFLRLEAEGIKPHITIDHGLTTSFYYQDPDGNSLELQTDNFGDWSKSKAWMSTSQSFVEDPLGSVLDPHQMIADRNAGVSVEEVHRRAYAREYRPSEKQTFYFPEEIESQFEL